MLLLWQVATVIRLWPLSRAMHPKQFLALNSKDTMLQCTVKRLSGLNVSSITTLCNEEHRFFVAEQMRQVDRLGPIILEPESRNTAPALALAALFLVMTICYLSFLLIM